MTHNFPAPNNTIATFSRHLLMWGRRLSTKCRELIQAALPELHLKKARLLTTQKDIKLQQMMHGVRLDVFAEDDQHRLYDLEMQVCNEHNLGQRSRYYQAKIDADSLRSGQDYQDIKRSYLISYPSTPLVVISDNIVF